MVRTTDSRKCGFDSQPFYCQTTRHVARKGHRGQLPPNCILAPNKIYLISFATNVPPECHKYGTPYKPKICSPTLKTAETQSPEIGHRLSRLHKCSLSNKYLCYNFSSSLCVANLQYFICSILQSGPERGATVHTPFIVQPSSTRQQYEDL